MSELYCKGCGKVFYDEKIEIFTFCGEAKKVCEDCSIKINNFLDSLKEGQKDSVGEKHE